MAEAGSTRTEAKVTGAALAQETKDRSLRLLGNERGCGATVWSAERLSADTRDALACIEDAVAQRVARHRADDALRRTLASLVESERLSHTGSWTWNLASGEHLWSREAMRICGFDPAVVHPPLDAVRERLHPRERLKVEARVARAIREGNGFAFDCRLVLPDGALRCLHAIGHPVWNDAGALIELTGTVMDLTARRIAERQLRTATRDRDEAVLAERTRIARELHDGLLQDAIGIALHLRNMLDEIRAESGATASALLRVVELAEKTTIDARQAIMDMRSSTADKDIATAVGRVLRRAAAPTALACSIAVRGQVRPLRPRVHDAVVRIAQEAITNVARHASARTMQVVLFFHERRLRVTIADDGIGFEAGASRGPSTGHFGLTGMRELADEARGSLDILSMPGTGTTVTLQVPLFGRRHSPPIERTGAGAQEEPHIHSIAQ
jgi:two-component system sensor histidine kinase UhpB